MDSVCEEILLTFLIREFMATKALDFSLSDTFNTRHSCIHDNSVSEARDPGEGMGLGS